MSQLPIIGRRSPGARAGEAPEGTPGDALSPEETVVAYHEQTKHHLHRFAASPGHLDWATQPDPFRRYASAPLVRLPLPPSGRELPFWRLYAPEPTAPAALSIGSVSLFFRYALSLTAWKRFRDSAWSLRANPSSGNLHPTEGYAILPPLPELHDRAGVFHYAPREHGLERRAELDDASFRALMARFPPDSFLVGLSSIHWREAWKYGERAFRYCQHDVGHALGALRFSAAALGWRLGLLDRVADADLSRLLGLDRDADYVGAEREHPDLLALVSREEIADELALELPDGVTDEVAASRWAGPANALSGEHGADWRAIDVVARATSRATSSVREDRTALPLERELFLAPVTSGRFTAEQVILGRRSAVSMDASTSIPAETFYRMLARLVPSRDGRSMPWDAISWRPRIHLGLFVHRVEGLRPGLYLLARDPAKLDALREALAGDFLWERPESCPRGLPLYLLREGDCRALAAKVSCGQEIAGDGAFSLGMIADYLGSLATFGAAFYRNLYWEAGLVGQVLYLEAEEAGIRSTGIGCYFDDAVHDLFGISSRDWQSFYHFTVGGPIEDARLTTLPAYDAESAR